MDKIQIILEAVERSKAALASATKQIDDLTAANVRQQGVVGRLNQFFQDQDKLLLGLKVTIAAVVAASLLLGKSAIENGDRLNKQASQLNTTTEKLSAYTFAADLANVSNDEFAQSLAFLNRALGEAETAGSGASKAFAQLKLDPSQFTDPLDALRGIAEAFQNSEGGAQKALIAQELFGRGSQRMISFLNEGADALDRGAAEAAAFGQVISGPTAKAAEDFEDNMTRLKAILSGTANEVITRLLPSLVSIQQTIIDNKDAVSELALVVGTLAAAITIAAAAWKAYAIAGGIAAAVLNLGAVANAKDYAAAIQLLVKTPWVAYTAGVLGAVEIIRAGAEAWKAWKAQQDLALSNQNLRKAGENIREETIAKIAEFEAAGKITAAKAAEMRKAIDEAFKKTKSTVTDIQPMGPATTRTVINEKSAAEQVDALRRIRNELVEVARAAAGMKPLEKNQLTPLVSEEVLKAQLSGQADLANAQNATTLALFRNSIEQEEALLKESFARRQITVDDYAAKLQLVNEKRFTVEEDFARREAEVRKTALEDLLKNTNDPATKTRATADLAIQAQELQTKLAEIDAKRVAAALQTEQQIAAARKGVVSQTVAQIQQVEQAAQLKFQQAIEQTEALRARGVITAMEAAKRQTEARGTYLQTLADEKAALEGVLATVQALNAESPGLFSPEEVGQLENQIEGVNSVGQRTAAEQPIGENDFGGQFSAAFGDLQNQAQITAATIAGTFKDVFNSAIGSISNGITGLIMGTQTWGQALRNIGTSILTTLVGAIVQMGVRWIATQLLMAIAGKAIMAASTAAAAPFAAASAAMWGPAALAASIASYGAAAGVGSSALISATATIGPIMAGFSAVGATGFEEGGLVPGAPSLHDNRLAHVASGEYIFDTASVMDRGAGWFAGLHAAIRGGNVEGFFANQRSASPRVGRSSFASGGLVGSQASIAAEDAMNVSIGFLDTRQREREFLRRDGVQVVIDELARRGTIVGS